MEEPQLKEPPVAYLLSPVIPVTPDPSTKYKSSYF